jgi:SulP family sulfate permease
VQTGAVGIALLAVAVAALTQRWRPAWRPVLVALAMASLLAALLRQAAPSLALGERMDVPMPGGHWWADVAALFSLQTWSDPVPGLLAGYALTVALLCSLDTLVAVSVVDGRMRRRRDANRELVAQGLANVASALAGGQATSPSVARSMELATPQAAHRHSVLAYAAALAALLWLGPELLGLLPLSAVGGLLLWQGARLVSPTLWRTPAAWTPFAGSPPSAGQRRLVAANWAMATLVAGAAVVLGLGPAVVIGGSFAVLLFVRTNMREVVAAAWTGRTRRSLKLRSPAATEALAGAGDRIVLFDLEGSLFFGTADALRARLQSLDPGVDSVILDLHQVSEVDVTAARILVEAAEDFAQRGRLLIFSEWPSHDPRRSIVDAVAGPRRRQFLRWSDYTDDALEAAEDRLLASLKIGGADPSEGPLPLSRCTLARDLDDQELAWLAAELHEVRFAPGELLFTIGQEGDAIFISLRGDIGLRMPGSSRRLASFAPGVALGEMSVLARGRRSAEAFAETEVLALRLPVDALDRLIHEHPALGAKLLRNLLLHLGDRLRVVTGDLAQWVSRSASGRAQRRSDPQPGRADTGSA